MKVNTPNAQPITQPVETAAPAKPVAPAQQEVAPESTAPQLTPNEAAQQTKARDGAARAQFARRTESLEGGLAGIEGVEVARVTPQQLVKQATDFVKKIAAGSDDAVAKHKEVGKALDKLSQAIAGMDNEQGLKAMRELNDLRVAIQGTQAALQERIDFGPSDQRAGLEHIMQKLDRLDRAANAAADF